MELQITNYPVIEALPEVNWNFAELKTALQERTDYYSTLVYTDEAEKELKADLAKLRKLDTVIQEKRKEIKKLYLAPYEKFEGELKEATLELTKVIKKLSDAEKEIQEKWKRERTALVEKQFYDCIGNLETLIKFEKIDISEMLKKSVSDKKALQMITDRVNMINSDMMALKAVPEKHRAYITGIYVKNLSLSEAMAEYQHVQKVEEIQRQREAEERATVRTAPPEDFMPVPEMPEEVAAIPQQEEPARCQKAAEPAREKKFFATFKAHGTKEQLLALIDFMDGNLIEFERL